MTGCDVGNRCTGHCCRDIAIRVSPSELEAQQIDDSRIEEGAHLAHILIEPRQDDEDGELWHYHCRYLMGCGDCGIYRSRPSMCSDYPYGKQCKNPECTWTAAGGGQAAE